MIGFVLMVISGLLLVLRHSSTNNPKHLVPHKSRLADFGGHQRLRFRARMRASADSGIWMRNRLDTFA